MRIAAAACPDARRGGRPGSRAGGLFLCRAARTGATLGAGLQAPASCRSAAAAVPGLLLRPGPAHRVPVCCVVTAAAPPIFGVSCQGMVPVNKASASSGFIRPALIALLLALPGTLTPAGARAEGVGRSIGARMKELERHALWEGMAGHEARERERAATPSRR